VFRAFDPLHVSVQLQENVLRNFFSQSAIAGHAPCQRKHHGLVFVHQLLEIRLPSLRHGFASTS